MDFNKLALFLLLALPVAFAVPIPIIACNTTINTTGDYFIPPGGLVTVNGTDCITFHEGANGSTLNGSFQFLTGNDTGNCVVLNGTNNISVFDLACAGWTNGYLLDNNSINNSFNNTFTLASTNVDFYCITPDDNYDNTNLCTTESGCDSWITSCGGGACEEYNVDYYAIRGAWQTIPTAAFGTTETYVPVQLGSPWGTEIVSILGALLLVAAAGVLLVTGRIGGIFK